MFHRIISITSIDKGHGTFDLLYSGPHAGVTARCKINKYEIANNLHYPGTIVLRFKGYN